MAAASGTDLPPQDDPALKQAVESAPAGGGGGGRSRDAATMKKMIIEHMNEDHVWSLQIYLRHFCGVSASEATTAQMTEVTTDHMLIRAGSTGKVYTVKFEPPMKNLGDARERVVEMHHAAMRALDLSDVVVTGFAWPNKPWQALVDATVLLCFTTFPFRSQLLPSSGSVASRVWSLGGAVPDLAALAYRLNPAVLVLMLLIHGVEAGYFARTRLRRHRVPLGGGLWFAWMVHAFVGGVACFGRFDDLVSQLGAERKRKKMEEKH